jgi:hypothetical protein
MQRGVDVELPKIDAANIVSFNITSGYNATNVESRDLDKRACYKFSLLEGNGNPAKWVFHKQVTETLTCASADCSVSSTNSHTIGWSASVGFSPPWTSGGFSVSESWSWGSSYTCGAKPGQTVCVWYAIAHTAYWARQYWGSTTGKDICNNPSDPFVIWSPNINNAGGGYYCVIGTCRNNNDGYWEDRGPL